VTLLWTVFFIGVLICYFLAQAFKVDLFTLEMLIHNTAHFFSGLIVLGLLEYFQAKHKSKVLLIIAFIVIVAGLIITHERNVSSDATDLTMVVYNSFLFFWGALSGSVLARNARAKKLKNRKE
jgi:ABC-type iron transport system FetAB permease component